MLHVHSLFFCRKNADSGQIWGADFEAPFRRKNGVFSFSTLFFFFYKETKYSSISTHVSFSVIKKSALLLFDALLFCLPKNKEYLLFDAFLKKNSFSTHFSRKISFRRTFLEKLLFDALLQKNSFSTHFSKTTPFRRFSPKKLFVACLYQNTFSKISQSRNTFRRNSSLKRFVDAFLQPNTLVLSHTKNEPLCPNIF